MTNEMKVFILSLIDETLLGSLVLSSAFLIVSAGLSLMKWVGVF